MRPIKCNEVTVRFIDRNKNGEHIERSNISQCEFLVVHQDAENLIVYYCRDLDGNTPLKAIVYNYSTVSEFSCIGIIQPPAPPKKVPNDTQSG